VVKRALALAKAGCAAEVVRRRELAVVVELCLISAR
jgi:hypothetical protein